MLRISILIILLNSAIELRGQDNEIRRAASPGIGFGFLLTKPNKLDFNLNYHWVKYVYNGKFDYYHISGLFAGVNSHRLNNSLYIGQQAGAYYHFFIWEMTLRSAITFESNLKGDKRIGAEAGLGWMCLFVYYGYYYPLGSFEHPSVQANRLGIRIILNPAGIKATPWN